MIVTGIGARKRPEVIRGIIFLIMNTVAERCLIRSGAALGCDADFEEFAVQKEIYLPWRGYNDSNSNLCLENLDPVLVEQAKEVVRAVYPDFDSRSESVQKLHTRNVFQILGKDLNTPSDVVICYTEDGAIKGGTGVTIKIAQYFDINVFNLGNVDDILSLIEIGFCDEMVVDLILGNG